MSRTRSEEALRSALGGLLAMAVAIGIGRFVYTPILPAMAASLGLSKSAAGLIASANFLGYLIGALGAAAPSLPGSRRAWLLGSLAASALTTAAMGLSASLPVFLALRFVGGGASAGVLILASTTVLEQLAASGRGRLSAVHFAGVGTGVVASAGLVAMLQRAGGSWQVLWLASGALSLAAAIAAGSLLADRPAALPASDRPAEQTGKAGLPRLVAAYGLFGFGYVITATFLVAIVDARPALRPLGPAVWIVFGLAAAPSVVLWGGLAARLGIPAAFAVACIVEAVGVLASVAWHSEAAAFAAAILVGGSFMGLTALGLLRAQALAAGDPRRAIAAMTGALGLGQIVGPAFAGILSDWLGNFAVPSATAVAALLAAAVLAADRSAGLTPRPPSATPAR